jgi:excisionase family DNA binding protein
MIIEPLLDLTRAAVILGIHRKTLERLARQGKIPSIRIGRLWRFRESHLDKWLHSQLVSEHHPCR